jgi:hypothetical protein
MLNVEAATKAVRALKALRREGVKVTWTEGGVEYRAARAPPDDVAALIDVCGPSIVNMMRPRRDGRSLFELAQKRHAQQLEDIDTRRPPDVDDCCWRAAMDGLEVFLLSGQSDEALRLGWPHDELFAVPPLWSRVDLCGVALLIGDREVVSVAPDKIQVKTASGATLSFYRKRQPDYRLVYETRRKSLVNNLGSDEARFRAFDFTVNFCRQHSGCDLEEAKALVRVAIADAKGAQK